jgi:hypothetical protein
MTIKNRALAVLLGLTAAALLAGCDSAGPVANGDSTPPPVSTQDPSAREAATAAPAADFGHTVHVTSAGIQPQSLISSCCAPVVFKNETGAPVSIVFFVGNRDSGPIPPGASWSWTPPNPESVGYHLGGDTTKTGHLQIESPSW